MTHEAEIVKAFIVKDRRERYLSLLSSPKGRKKFIERLPHGISDELDPRYAQRIDGSASQIEHLLRRKGAPEICYVISEDGGLDGREMPLLEALEETVGRGMGTLISCVPGKLAYFEAEDIGERYILKQSV